MRLIACKNFRRTVCVWVLGFLTSSAFAASQVSVVPVLVWQGKTPNPWTSSLAKKLRDQFPGQPFVHAVDPVYYLKNEAQQDHFRFQLSEVIRPGDDIILHVAPWKRWMEKVGQSDQVEPTILGTPLSADQCDDDCGLELSVTAYTSYQVKSMVQFGQKIFADHGLGQSRALIFEEGLVPVEYRRSALTSGVSSDWSGIEMKQFESVMGRFPVFSWNVERSAPLLSALDSSKTEAEGLRLDFLRFAIHTEIADQDSSRKIMEKAIQTAKEQGRKVLLPLFVNAEDLIHSKANMGALMQLAKDLVQASGVNEAPITALNQGWDVSKIRPKTIPASQQVPIAEAEFVSDEELAELQHHEVLDAEAPESLAPSDPNDSTNRAH